VACAALASTIAAVALPADEAHAQTIKTPNGHPAYRAELEPHLTLAVFNRGLWAFDRGRSRFWGDPGVGAGFRASIEIADPAFIKKLNNTVAITFGADITTCDYCRDSQLYLPVGLQWNFFFSKEWSAFGEAGLVGRSDFDGFRPDFMLAAGGRYLFNDSVALTARIGYPFFTFGVSFFVGS
jgi:hypothetical protein